MHFEFELVVALARGGRDIPEAGALDHVWGYGVGLDMTRRNLQGAAKKAGRPWEIGKAFDRGAPMSPLVPASRCGHPACGRITLAVKGETRQDGDLDRMIWKVPEMIAYLSRYFDLSAGDLIITGTPAGVGPTLRGDVLTGSVDGVGALDVRVV